MLEIDTNKLSELFRDFYSLTNIQICLFDDEMGEILRYPEKPCAFCALVRQNADINKKCIENDKTAFAKCKDLKARYTYRCHMDLVESATPIFFEDSIIGYVMIGQVADTYSVFDELLPKIRHLIADNDIETAREKYNAVPQVPDEKIRAAAHIVDACASYLYVSKLVKLQSMSLSQRIDAFIRNNIQEKITIDLLCRELYCSRVELYSIFKNLFGSSVADYIKSTRIDHAKKLLTETTLPISKIATQCGIPDYNYFSKIFKKETGLSAIEYRKTKSATSLTT